MILITLFGAFLKIGAFTFGGGYAMLPMIQEAVSAHGWLGGEALVNFIAVSESTPGPFAVNIATYVGFEVAGIAGALCATLGVVLPSFVIVLVVARCFDRFRESRVVRGCMAGLKPAVVGLIGAAMVSVARTVFAPEGLSPERLQAPEFWLCAVVFAIAAVLAHRKAHPIAIIALSAALGVLGGYVLGL